MFNERCSLVNTVSRRQTAPMKLDQDRIVAAALELMQVDGLDALAMRSLAARLGVRASALYWHVADKNRLYALMAEHFYRTAYRAAGCAPDAGNWLETLGRQFRANLLAYRDSARLCALSPPSVHNTPEVKQRLTVQLISFGMTEGQALNAIASVLALTLGWVVYEQSETMHEHLRGMLDFDTAYEAGLRAVVEGLAPRAIA